MEGSNQPFATVNLARAAYRLVLAANCSEEPIRTGTVAAQHVNVENRVRLLRIAVKHLDGVSRG